MPRNQAQSLLCRLFFSTPKRFFDAIESHLPSHRERTYPPTETLAMFIAQVLNDDGTCQRAVNDRIVRCLQHGLRPPGTSTAGLSQRQIATSQDIGYGTVSNYLGRARKAGLSWPLPDGMGERELGANPLSDEMFVFVIRKKTQMKILYFDGDGYAGMTLTMCSCSAASRTGLFATRQ